MLCSKSDESQTVLRQLMVSAVQRKSYLRIVGWKPESFDGSADPCTRVKECMAWQSKPNRTRCEIFTASSELPNYTHLLAYTA